MSISGDFEEAFAEGFADLGGAVAVFDHEAGDFVLLADGSEAFGDAVADEAAEEEDEVDAVVSDALFQGVERGGFGVFVGFPVEAVEVEEAFEGFADVFADGAADHQGAFALGGGDQVYELGAEGVWAGVGFVLLLAEAVEVSADGAEAVAAADMFTEGEDELEELGVGGAQAVDGEFQDLEEFVEAFVGELDAGHEGFQIGEGDLAGFAGDDEAFGFAGLLLASEGIPASGGAGGVEGLGELFLGFADIGWPVGVIILSKCFDITRFVLFAQGFELVEEAEGLGGDRGVGIGSGGGGFGGGLELAVSTDPDFKLCILFDAGEAAVEG